MPEITGILRKLKTEYHDPILYYARIDDQEIFLNPWIGKNITFTYTGNIYCIQCGRKTSQSYQQGYCYPCWQRLQSCGFCLLHPERCAVEQGTCPDTDWAHEQCKQIHIVYLANTSDLKVGITREAHVLTRWMDQGAVQAMPLFRASNRYRAGIMEVALKAYVADRTNWRIMLRNQAPVLDLHQAQGDLYQVAQSAIDAVKQESLQYRIEDIPRTDVKIFHYPVLTYPSNIIALSLDRQPVVQGRLLGIKGQYLILDIGVFHVRKFGGYEVHLALY